MLNIKRSFGVAIFVFATMSLCGCGGNRWQNRFNSALPEYGHRNWIVIADSAYPKQSAPGIETIATGKEQLEVLDVVLDAIADAQHVQAIVMLDAELDSVTEADAPGVTEYRSKLKASLKGKQVKVMPHEDIIAELDEGAEMFNILLLKTDLTIPYTSVFLQLDCGYWNAEKEKRLRDAMAGKD
jgi:L-fucose mutarotase/ribose pyranase (RbsD/FucU family)